MRKIFAAVAGIAALALPYAPGQARAFGQTGCRGTVVSGTVRDSTEAVIPGAALILDGGSHEVSGPDGRFRFACVSAGKHVVTAIADGFAKSNLSFTAPNTLPVEMVLKPKPVETELEVSGDTGAAESASASGVTTTISGSQLQSLADDPDDLQRELQQLAAAAGGSMANTTISVDGFQGSSALPPKSSIAYIKVNPDQFSAEYREPPFEGGRVEVYTKPGQKAYHGSLFATNSSPWANARDPFSTSKASIGKQRYGFELMGPVRKAGSDFALTLEHRSIDNFAVVNAVTLDGEGKTVSTIANVATPQRLWLGTARLDWQLGAKNTFITSYSANVNHLTNVGVGGASLAETGYESERYEHMFRVSDITTASAHVMHEARLSLRWDGETDTPVSTAPQVEVAGAFTGGGATLGPQQLHELNIEYDDDAIWTTKNHRFKFGDFLMMYDEHQQLTTNFNGTYTFGGGIAPVLDAHGQPVPGETMTITGVEQYRRALLGLAGGTPTAYSNVMGTPAVNFTQFQNSVFFQDDWNAGHGVHVSYGVRYFVQNDPKMLDSATPRLGILWSPTKKGTWTLHGHWGMFAGRLGQRTWAEIRRMDGAERVTNTVYNPTTFANPLVGGTAIQSMRTVAPHMGNMLWGAENIGGTRAFSHGWNLSVDYYLARFWNDTRSENVNSPLNDVPTGPRPGPANVNVLQMQASGQGRANATFAAVEQHTLKHVQFFFGGVRVELVDDTDDNEFFTPQSSRSNAGEFAHRSGQSTWNLFGNGTVKLPEKIDWSINFNGGSGGYYNITTGFDNNGDGNFNDRPQYATAGTPGAIQTPYGLLVASGGTGVFPRNQGKLPWTVYMDMNLQRAFKITRDAKAEHQQTLTVNVRSSNVLNHLNVTQEGGVLGSPQFGVPYAADNGRRLEGGLRYSF